MDKSGYSLGDEIECSNRSKNLYFVNKLLWVFVSPTKQLTIFFKNFRTICGILLSQLPIIVIIMDFLLFSQETQEKDQGAYNRDDK